MKKILISILVALIFWAGNTTILCQSRKLKLAVLDFKGKDVAPKFVDGTAELLRIAISNLNVFDVVEYADMLSVFKKEEIADASCNDIDCAIKLGRMLKADKVIIASINRTGGTLIVTPKTINVKKEKLEFEDKPCFISMSGLDSGAEDLAKRLVKKMVILEGYEPTKTVESKNSTQLRDKITTTADLPTEIVWEQDSSPMILIRAGEFVMGVPENKQSPPVDEKSSHGGHSENKEDKKPLNVEHKEYVDAFYVDKYEVTNEKFAKFLNAYGKDVDESGNKLVYPHDWGVVFDYGKWKPSQESYRKYPVTNVTWYGAYKYAEWAGKQLPTGSQWEKSARGGDGRLFPWGSKLDNKKCNCAGTQDGYQSLAPVGSFPEGKSPYGCMDMAGNVWEWTAELMDKPGSDNKHSKTEMKKPAEKDVMLLKGGSWDGELNFCRTFVRIGGPPKFYNTKIGFRCVVSVNRVR